MINVRDYGAVGDGIVDDTIALQTAINAGNRVYMPQGEYKITSTLLLNKANHILEGDGNSTKLKCAGNIDAVKFAPVSSYPIVTFDGGGKIRDFYISGSIKNALVFDVAYTSATERSYIVNHAVENICCDQVTENSILMNNTTNNNGYSGSIIQNCMLYGGIKLIGAGDSLIIRDNIITGTGLGIKMSFIGGAACSAIYNNSITTTKQALQIGYNVCLLQVYNNQIEKWRPESENTGYTVEFLGLPNARSKCIEFYGNNVYSLGHSTQADVLLYYCDYVKLDNNIINKSPPVYILGGNHTVIGKNNLLAGPIVNQGVNTIFE